MEINREILGFCPLPELCLVFGERKSLCGTGHKTFIALSVFLLDYLSNSEELFITQLILLCSGSSRATSHILGLIININLFFSNMKGEKWMCHIHLT